MAEIKYESKIGQIAANDAAVFSVLSNLENINRFRDAIPQDKIQELDVASNVVTPVAATANQQIASEAVAALSMLGFASTQSQKAVAKILSDEPALSVEQVIKKALKLL